MSRTDLDAETLARSLRAMAGDGSIEWVMEPMQASVLLDIADALDENAKLREERDYYKALWEHATATDCELRRVRTAWKEDRKQNAKLRQIAARMWPMATRAKRCTFADRLKLRAEIDELGIEVEE